MRMWQVDPRVLCTKHLLGEHVETHMFVGAMRKGTSMRGFIDNGLLDGASLADRHEDLVSEMTRRGMKHKSPLPQVPEEHCFSSPIDTAANLLELARRCPDCLALQKQLRCE